MRGRTWGMVACMHERSCLHLHAQMHTSKGATQCFTPSQPAWLYQGEGAHKQKLKLHSQRKSTSWNAAMHKRSARGDQLTAHLIGNSTSLSILSRHRAFLKEKRLSWMTRVWGSLHTDICLLASRCSLQLGQYLQTPRHAQATVQGTCTGACCFHT